MKTMVWIGPLVFVAAFSSCTTRVAETGQSVFVRLRLPAQFVAPGSIEAHVIVDERADADGGLFAQPAAPLRGKTDEGFDAEQEVASFDGDGNLEWRLRVLSNPFGAQTSWGVWITGTSSAGFRVVGRIVTGTTTIAEGVATNDLNDAGIQFGPSERTVEVQLVCVRADLCYGPDGGVDAGVDAGLDAGVDAGGDASVDAGVDAGPDAGTGADASVDAGFDAGPAPDAGPPCTGVALRAAATDWVLTDAGCSQGTGCKSPSLRWDSQSGKWAVVYQGDVASPSAGSKIFGLEFGGVSDAGVIEGATAVTELASFDAGFYPANPELYWDAANMRFILLFVGGTSHPPTMGPVFMSAYIGGFSVIPNSTRQVSCQQGACDAGTQFSGASVAWNGTDYGMAFLSNSYFYFARLNQDVTLGLVPFSETRPPTDAGVNTFGSTRRFLAWASSVSDYGIVYQEGAPPATRIGRITQGGSVLLSTQVGASGPPPPESATVAWNPVKSEYAVVYIQGVSSTEYVRFARVNSVGTTVAGPLILDSTDATASIIQPTISVASNGDYGVAWGYNATVATDTEIRFCLVHPTDTDSATCTATKTRVSGPVTGSAGRAMPSIEWSLPRREWGIAWHGNASPNSIFFNAVICQ